MLCVISFIIFATSLYMTYYYMFKVCDDADMYRANKSRFFNTNSLSYLVMASIAMGGSMTILIMCLLGVLK